MPQIAQLFHGEAMSRILTTIHPPAVEFRYKQTENGKFTCRGSVAGYLGKPLRVGDEETEKRTTQPGMFNTTRGITCTNPSYSSNS